MKGTVLTNEGALRGVCARDLPLVDALVKAAKDIEDARAIEASKARVLQDELEAVKAAFTDSIVADIAAARQILEADLGDLVVNVSGWKMIAAKLRAHEERIKAALVADALK